MMGKNKWVYMYVKCQKLVSTIKIIHDKKNSDKEMLFCIECTGDEYIF